MAVEHTPPAPSSPSAGTPPSLTSNSGTATPQRTNTLVIAQLPPTFFEAIVLDTLRRHFGTYGPIYAWAPLKSFARIILVYYSEDDAEQAKDACDRLLVGPSEDSPAALLRVYRADRTTIVVNEAEYDNIHLRPPKLEKNFLISPPGSPPVGWEPILEHPPNATPLAEDLMTALRHLQLQEEHRDCPPGIEVLLEPEDGVGISVYVEDCDGGEGGAPAVEEDWNYGETSPARAQWRPMPTSMPPAMHVGA